MTDKEAAHRIADRWLRTKLAASLGPDDGVIYTAIFLDPMSRQRLLKRFDQTHPDLQAHHMTLWFYQDGGEHHVDELPLGKTVALKVVGYVEDGKAQAVIVDPPTRLRPQSGRTPHITISTAPGVTPAYSNTLIEKAWDTEEARRGFPTLTGKVGWFGGGKERFVQPQD